MKILAIESSCDETAAAVIEDGRKICSSVIDSQVEEHKLYGGVVPEIASRRHAENICAVVEKALSDAGESFESIDAVAVTYAPGLIGALLVGVNYAKGVSKRKAADSGSSYQRTYCGELSDPPGFKTAVFVFGGIGRTQPHYSSQ